jgi:hypothetical protein
MSAEPQRTCPSCGNEFSGTLEFCPVCMLRKGLAGGVESGESSLQETVRPTLTGAWLYVDAPRKRSTRMASRRCSSSLDSLPSAYDFPIPTDSELVY